MNYSTFNINNFFIKKDSTLPELKYRLSDKIIKEYNITDAMLNNVAITFSMIDAETGQYKVANVPAGIIFDVVNEDFPDVIEYILYYKFRSKDTKKIGKYYGEFVIDFLDDNAGCGKLKLPISSKNINIIISDTITKTTVL